MTSILLNEVLVTVFCGFAKIVPFADICCHFIMYKLNILTAGNK